MSTTFGSSRCSSTHWAETREFSRVMCFYLSCAPRGARGLGEGGFETGLRPSSTTDSLEQEVHLAAEAEPEDGVEQRRHQREADGDEAEHVEAEGEPDQSDEHEDQADRLREPRRRRVL